MSARRQRLGSEGVRGGARGAKREKTEINRNKETDVRGVEIKEGKEITFKTG